jgi:hypothetical protein
MSNNPLGLVYFLGNPDGLGLIKIGFSRDPLNRERSIQLGSPIPLVRLAFCAGDEETEYRFHARYQTEHAYGEWFSRSALLMADVLALNEGTFDKAALMSGCLPPPFKSGVWCLPRFTRLRLKDEGLALVEKGMGR